MAYRSDGIPGRLTELRERRRRQLPSEPGVAAAARPSPINAVVVVVAGAVAMHGRMPSLCISYGRRPHPPPPPGPYHTPSRVPSPQACSATGTFGEQNNCMRSLWRPPWKISLFMKPPWGRRARSTPGPRPATTWLYTKLEQAHAEYAETETETAEASSDLESF